MLLPLDMILLLWNPGPDHFPRVYTSLHIRPSTPSSWVPGPLPLTSPKVWATVRRQRGPAQCLMMGKGDRGGLHPPQLPAPLSRLSPSGSLPRFPPPLNVPNTLLPEQTLFKRLFVRLCYISSPLIVLNYLHLRCPGAWVDYLPQGASNLMGETKIF